MSSGLSLVKSYLDSLMSGRTEEFARQVSPNFRYRFLPESMGKGPLHAARWRELSYSIYRKWEWEIVDSSEVGGEVVVWLNVVGRDPSEPGVMNRRFEGPVLLKFDIEDGMLVGCHGFDASLDEYAESMAALG